MSQLKTRWFDLRRDGTASNGVISVADSALTAAQKKWSYLVIPFALAGFIAFGCGELGPGQDQLDWEATAGSGASGVGDDSGGWDRSPAATKTTSQGDATCALLHTF